MPSAALALAPLLARVCRAHYWSVAEGAHPTHIKAALTDARIAAHLAGNGPRIGVCPMRPGHNTTLCALLDLDSHKGEIAWSDMLEEARGLIEALDESGLKAIPFRSAGGAGVHLYLLWKQPQDAYSVRQALAIALAKCNLTSGTRGIAHNEVEIFPKQNEVASGAFGSMFVLPLAGKSRALLNNGILDDTIPQLIKWSASDAVEVRPRPAPEKQTNTAVPADLIKLAAALDAIPNENDREQNYDAWRNVVFAIHSATDGSDAGRELAHRFSARSVKYNSEFLDTRVWPYIRSDRPAAITVRTIYSMASANGWIDPDVIADFDVVTPEKATSATQFSFIPAHEFIHGTAPTWIVKGVLPQAALAMIYGESTSGKTFFALDLTGAIAQGAEWCGRAVKRGRVGYICAEGVHGFRNRVKAYMQAHELQTLDIEVMADAPNFMEADDIKNVLAAVAAAGPLSVIIVDTFARVMPGANENSGEDVGKAVYHCQQLHAQTGALIVLIHHSGKDATKGARGWSGLRAACDAEIEITRFENDRVATITKLKDGEDGAEIGFALTVVPLGDNYEGEAVTSCTVSYRNNGPTRTASGARRRLGPNEGPVLAALRELDKLVGSPVTKERLIDEAKKHLAEDGPRARDGIVRALGTLQRDGYLRIEDKDVWLL